MFCICHNVLCVYHSLSFIFFLICSWKLSSPHLLPSNWNINMWLHLITYCCLGFTLRIESECLFLCSAVDMNIKEQMELSQEREKLNREMEEMKLMDEEEKRRCVRMNRPPWPIPVGSDLLNSSLLALTLSLLVLTVRGRPAKRTRRTWWRRWSGSSSFGVRQELTLRGSMSRVWLSRTCTTRGKRRSCPDPHLTPSSLIHSDEQRDLGLPPHFMSDHYDQTF